MTSACGGGSSATAPSSGSTSTGANFPAGQLVLTHSVVDPTAILWITPLGNLNPPAHTLPTDHIYFYIADPDLGQSPASRRTPFYAPGSGTVSFMIGGLGQESKVMVRQTSTMTYYVDHVILTTPLAVGTVITAGQVIGTSGSAYAVDLGVINDNITVDFVNPSRYINTSDSLHADAPLKYYAEPLRSQLYAKVQRLGADLDGRISYDKANTLAGNWFSQFGNGPLSFAFDTYDPSRPLVSTGVGPRQGVFSIAAGDPLPETVTVASGRVLYSLRAGRSGPGRAEGAPFWMLVQLSDATHMRAEIFTSLPTDFSASAISFLR
jgi:hypothetical protein